MGSPIPAPDARPATRHQDLASFRCMPGAAPDSQGIADTANLFVSFMLPAPLPVRPATEPPQGRLLIQVTIAVFWVSVSAGPSWAPLVTSGLVAPGLTL